MALALAEPRRTVKQQPRISLFLCLNFIVVLLRSLKKWSTFLKRRKLTARTRNAKSIPCIRSPSTKKGRIALLSKARDDTTASSQVMVVRQNPFSIKRQKQLRRLC